MTRVSTFNWLKVDSVSNFEYFHFRSNLDRLDDRAEQSPTIMAGDNTKNKQTFLVLKMSKYD